MDLRRKPGSEGASQGRNGIRSVAARGGPVVAQTAARAVPDRIMVYCHDLFGLGNIKRMLQYCHHLRSAFPQSDLLFVMGSTQISLFSLPERLDYIKLPEIARRQCGAISARVLDMEATRIAAFRAEILRNAAEAFDPDLLIIDKKPLGAMDELGPTLAVLRQDCARILVCRDILDAPMRTIAEMAQGGFHGAVRAHIDQIQVLGDRHVFDFGRAYRLPDAVRGKLRYAGYMAAAEIPQPRAQVLSDIGFDPGRKTVLATVGGGEDGSGVLAHALAYAETHPDGPQMLLLTGPHLPHSAFHDLRGRAERLPHARVLRSSNDVVSLVHASDVVVSMAGYNSVCGILAAQKPCILLPRTEPSREQVVRAELLSRLGLAQSLSWQCNAQEFGSAIDTALLLPRPETMPIRFDGDETTRRIGAGVSEAMGVAKAQGKGPVRCRV